MAEIILGCIGLAVVGAIGFMAWLDHKHMELPLPDHLPEPIDYEYYANAWDRLDMLAGGHSLGRDRTPFR